MRGRRKRWLRVSVFHACERVEGTTSSRATGPWDLFGVWHAFRLHSPLSELPGTLPIPCLTLFVRLMNRSKRISSPRELEAHLYRRDQAQFICRYRFPARSFQSGSMVYMALPLQPPSLSTAGWYEFLLVLDDDERTVLARTEVYLIP